MGTPRQPRPGALFVSILRAPTQALEPVLELLCAQFGPLACLSPEWPFSATHYYAEEMGTGLLRHVAVFSTLLPRALLAQAKHTTNKLEQQFLAEGRRRVNLDPGLLNLENIQLASTKGHAHRVYVGQGLFVETTALFRDGAFHALPWTYPDYAQGPVPQFLAESRRFLDPVRHQKSRPLQQGTDPCEA